MLQEPPHPAIRQKFNLDITNQNYGIEKQKEVVKENVWEKVRIISRVSQWFLG